MTTTLEPEQRQRDLSPHTNFTPLKPSRTVEEFDLHELALEWSLADPIIIESVEDIKSKANWQDQLEPYQHQMQNLMTFCKRLPVTELQAPQVRMNAAVKIRLSFCTLRDPESCAVCNTTQYERPML